MRSTTSRTGAGRGWVIAALAAALLAGPAMAQTTSPSAQTIRPNGTHLKPSDPLGAKPPACIYPKVSRKTAGPSHDGAELEARVRAMPTTCSQGTFVAAGDVWCEQNPQSRYWRCFRPYRCDIQMPNCKPGSRAQ